MRTPVHKSQIAINGKIPFVSRSLLCLLRTLDIFIGYQRIGRRIHLRHDLGDAARVLGQDGLLSFSPQLCIQQLALCSPVQNAGSKSGIQMGGGWAATINKSCVRYTGTLLRGTILPGTILVLSRHTLETYT